MDHAAAGTSRDLSGQAGRLGGRGMGGPLCPEKPSENRHGNCDWPACDERQSSPISQFVIQGHDHPCDDVERAVRSGLGAGDGSESALSTGDTRDQRVPEAAGGAIAKKGRVLLLEDDPAFREILRDWLVENGYGVVAVQNGGEGVREVLANDFTLVLCDVQMPGLSGDLFYRAVERIRADLCKRFIFMTGHHNNARTDEFIKSINGFMLRKPFRFEELTEAISVAEVVCTFQSVAESTAPNPAPSPGRLSAGGNFRAEDSALSEKVARILARGQAASAPAEVPCVVMHGGAQARVRSMFHRQAFAGVALFLALAAGLGIPYWALRDRVALASAERLALDAEWTVISRKLEDAIATRSKAEKARIELAAVSADRAKPKWAPALRSLVATAGTGIQVREVRASEEAGDTTKWMLAVNGVATGAAPRTVAERYRLVVERNLVLMFGTGVAVRFERFDELPEEPSATAEDRRGTFRIVATILFEKMTPKPSEGGA